MDAEVMSFPKLEESESKLEVTSADYSIHSFSIGICASDDDSNLPSLLKRIVSEEIPPGFHLERIVVVLSGATSNRIGKIAKDDRRVVLIEERQRSGKAAAINKILEICNGEFLLLINGDSLPSKGSTSMLLEMISKSVGTGVVSACPYFESKTGVSPSLEKFLWDLHNESSFRLNHLDLSNHTNDEMMILRRNLIDSLPYGLVNDGAYIAASARGLGYSVKFCLGAKVKIDVPLRVVDTIEQRRRILFGHFQVWKLVGRSPLTVESLLLRSPLLSLKIIVSTIARTPRFLMVLPYAIICETISLFFALFDSTGKTDKHRVWKRYASRNMLSRNKAINLDF